MKTRQKVPGQINNGRETKSEFVLFPKKVRPHTPEVERFVQSSIDEGRDLRPDSIIVQDVTDAIQNPRSYRHRSTLYGYILRRAVKKEFKNISRMPDGRVYPLALGWQDESLTIRSAIAFFKDSMESKLTFDERVGLAVELAGWFCFGVLAAFRLALHANKTWIDAKSNGRGCDDGFSLDSIAELKAHPVSSYDFRLLNGGNESLKPWYPDTNEVYCADIVRPHLVSLRFAAEEIIRLQPDVSEVLMLNFGPSSCRVLSGMLSGGISVCDQSSFYSATVSPMKTGDVVVVNAPSPACRRLAEAIGSGSYDRIFETAWDTRVSPIEVIMDVERYTEQCLECVNPGGLLVLFADREYRVMSDSELSEQLERALDRSGKFHTACWSSTMETPADPYGPNVTLGRVLPRPTVVTVWRRL